MRGFALAALALLFACGTPVAAREAGPAQLRLIDQRGQPFSLADLAGRPTLVTFVATRCTDACPIVNGVFGSLGAI